MFSHPFTSDFTTPLQATYIVWDLELLTHNRRFEWLKIEFCIILERWWFDIKTPPVFDFILNFPKYLLYEVLSSILTNLYSIIDEQPNAKTFLWSMFLYSSWIILHFPDLLIITTTLNSSKIDSKWFELFILFELNRGIIFPASFIIKLEGSNIFYMKMKFQNTELSWPKDRSSHNFDIILIEKHKSVEI